MKLTKFTNVLALSILLAVAGAGCKHRSPTVTPLPNGGSLSGPEHNIAAGGTLGSGGGGAPIEGGGGLASNPAGSHDGWIPHPDILKADTVYFAYDSSAIKDAEKSKVAAVADYLKSNAGDAVRIEGHCDERGTEEYNRALGERRALALREALSQLGVEPTRVDTISYGKDRPAEAGHDEAAWSKNRRGEFIVLTAPK
jgi:peptidoglycan-associated lipoprotein